MLNKVILLGRITQDLELKITQSGISVISFPLAVKRNKKEDETDFIDIVAWRNTAEFISKYFTKGQLIAVEGRNTTRVWTDRDGNKRKAVEVIVDEVYFAEGKKDKPAQKDEPQGNFEGEIRFEEIGEQEELPF